MKKKQYLVGIVSTLLIGIIFALNFPMAVQAETTDLSGVSDKELLNELNDRGTTIHSFTVTELNELEDFEQRAKQLDYAEIIDSARPYFKPGITLTHMDNAKADILMNVRKETQLSIFQPSSFGLIALCIALLFSFIVLDQWTRRIQALKIKVTQPPTLPTSVIQSTQSVAVTPEPTIESEYVKGFVISDAAKNIRSMTTDELRDTIAQLIKERPTLELFGASYPAYLNQEAPLQNMDKKRLTILYNGLVDHIKTDIVR